MAIGKFELGDKQRRTIFAIAIALVSLGFIPYVSEFVIGILNWKLGNTNFTVGTIFAIVSLYGAWLLSPFRRTL